MVGGATAAAGLVGLGAAAWACTQRVGTFTGCEPPSKTYDSAICAKITGTTQSGKIGGAGGVPNGGTISARAANFKKTLYQVTFRPPGTTADCHRPTSGGSVVLKDIATGATSFMGPSFYKTFTLPTVASTGAAKLCSQDQQVVTGQVLDFTVV